LIYKLLTKSLHEKFVYIMKSILHIIESNNLFGLADNYNIEIVECVYEKIKHLKNGKYIIIKDKMAGILDRDGRILFYPQAKRIHYDGIDIFHYKIDDKRVYFSFINNDVFYLSVDKLRYDEKLQIINVWKDGELKVYNYDFSQIQTGYDQIEKTELKQGTSRFYLGKKDNMWGMFRIKRAQKHELEIITTLDPVCCNPEEVLLAFKNSRHNIVRKHKRTKDVTTVESQENNN